jgi:hypothetical protein
MKVLCRIALLLGFIVLAISGFPAFAGQYADALADCLVKSTSNSDKNTLVQWMFVTAALHPELRNLLAATDAQRSELNMKTAQLIQTLLTESCLAQTKAALRNEGEGTIQSSFSVLGQAASQEIFSNPEVASGIAELGKYFDLQKLERTIEEK